MRLVDNNCKNCGKTYRYDITYSNDLAETYCGLGCAREDLNMPDASKEKLIKGI